jgi:hypothetical protein
MERAASQVDIQTLGSEEQQLNLYQILLERIDMRSFSNLWYWIMLAVMWSSASHWVLGVPFDLITRARRQGGALQSDLETMVRINTERMLFIARTSGVWSVGFMFFLLTTLCVLAGYYRVEFAQAVLLLLIPMTLLALLSLRTAAMIEAGENTGDALHRRLNRHRMSTQALGMLSIFVTSLFGMWVNLYVGVAN